MQQGAPKGVVAPLTLQRLLDTHQATVVLPGVLYFATTGECLSSSTPATLAVSSSSDHEASFKASGSSPTSAIAVALRDFFLKENPCWPPNGSEKLENPDSAGSNNNDRNRVTSPATNAAVGTDAIFIAPRGTAPYVYRPFFADFGPLDVGCCVHFARRLRELLHAVSHVDHASKSSASNAGGGSVEHNVSLEAGIAGSSCDNATQKATSLRGQEDTSPSLPTVSASKDTTNGTNPLPVAFASSPPNTITTATSSSTLPVVICASLNAQERVNTACLVGAFCLLVLGWSTTFTWSRVFADVYPSFLTYRDASTGVSNYPLSLQDVWLGLEQAVQLGWIHVDTFDLPAYWDGKAKDFSWIVPRRFLAMSSPRDTDPLRTAEVLAPRLRAMNVRLVIRLNDKLYNPAPLLRLGIRHVDLPYADGSTPNDATLLQFLQAVEKHFGENVAPSSPRQWWSAPSTMGIASGAGMQRHRNKSSSASPAATGDTTVTHNNSGGRRAESAKSDPQYAACSLLHSGKYRGMPDTRTVIPPPLNAPSTTKENMSASGAAVIHGGHHTSAITSTPGELGAVAVHCLAGLGRTGTMIAVYVMRHYGFTARGVIGWMRLCRPGSITGVQQQYLDAIERRLRPSPRVWATQVLKEFMRALDANTTVKAVFANSSRSPPPSSTASSAAAGAVLLSDYDSSAGGVDSVNVNSRGALPAAAGTAARIGRRGATPRVLPRVEQVLQPSPHTAGSAAFQVHGNVVGDARPPTGGMGSGLVQHRESGQWYESEWSSGGGGGLQGLLLRRAPIQQQQNQQRRRSSTSSLSFSTDLPDSTPFDAVSSMPVLGGAVNERLRRVMSNLNGNHNNNNGTSAPAAATFPGGIFGDNLINSTLTAATVRGLPRAGDYKYVSTYFVALERANRRAPQQHHHYYSSSSSITNNTTASSASPGRQPYAARGKPPRSANATTAMNATDGSSMTNATRAATASATGARRSSRLETPRQQQQSTLPRFSIVSSCSPEPLSRDASFGRKSSFPYQRRVSLMSTTAYGTGGSTTTTATTATPGREGSAHTLNTITTRRKWSLADDLTGDALRNHRPFTTTAVNPSGLLSTLERCGDNGGNARLRKTPQKHSDRTVYPVRPLASPRSSFSRPVFSWRQELEAVEEASGDKPFSALVAASRGEGECDARADAAAAFHLFPALQPLLSTNVEVRGGVVGGGNSAESRSGAISKTVLPPWGRAV